jgi:hypothetical protein
VPVSFSPQVGDRIAGRFELLSQLRGQGAVRVFSAHDHHTDRAVSILLVDPGRTRASAWETFAGIVTYLTRARVAGLVLPQVDSPAPKPPYCLEEPQDLQGFDRWRDQGPLPWQRVLALGERVAAILYEASAATGVAHRALTPSRCATTRFDDVRVLDYGVAELERGLPDEAGYRAPEQQQGGGDPRSDIYTLGLILFELITGRSWARTTPPSLSSCVAVPEPVDEFFTRVLSQDPAQRHSDVAEMRAAMRLLIDTVTDPPLSQRSTSAAHPTVPASTATPGVMLTARRTAARANPTPLPTADRTEIVQSPAPTPQPADRTEIVAKAPAPVDRTEVVAKSASSPQPADRTEIVAAPAPADRTEVLAPGATGAPPAADRTALVRPAVPGPPAARAGQAPQWQHAGPQPVPILRPAAAAEPSTERVAMPLPADTTLLLPSSPPPRVAPAEDALASPQTATNKPPDPLRKALIWINVLCFTGILLALCIRLLS